MKRHIEDFVPGEVIEAGEWVMTEEDIITFAKKYDPQPYHVDSEKAKDSKLFGGLCASGAQTVAIAIRLMTDVFSEADSQGSPGWDMLKWLRPVRPGDTLSLRWTCKDVRLLESRPDMGLVRADVEVRNQDGEAVMAFKQNWFVGRRNGENGASAG